MKTRFDGKVWVAAFGVPMEVKDMETAHLLNTVKMLVQKPASVQAMLVDDIESAAFASTGVWTAGPEDTRKQSIHNVTSLSGEDLTAYVIKSPLFKAMVEELETRGVNTDNILELYTKDPAFSA